MFRNYLKVALRNLLKHKGYSFINAVGLSIGIGCCLFILAVGQYEFSYDHHHEKGERIYRVTDRVQVAEDRVVHTATTPYPWGGEMSHFFPEVEASARFVFGRMAVRHNDNLVAERAIYTGPTFFDIFSYDLLRGDEETALDEPYAVILSERYAEKYFPGEDALGKVMRMDGQDDYRVTGIFKNPPPNSYFTLDMVMSRATLEAYGYSGLDDWTDHRVHTFVLLREGAEPVSVEARFPEFMSKYIDAAERDRFSPALQPLFEMHFSNLQGDWGDTIDREVVYIFAVIAVLVLLIACINFMNLATARSSSRVREVGMRKVLGAHRLQLVRQFLTESVLISFVSLIFAIALVEVALPWFNGITGSREVSINYLGNNFYVISLFVITLLVGILSGSYPAFFLSRFHPAAVLKGDKSGGAARLRKVLVVAQFVVAVFMITANYILLQQIKFLQNKDLGFERSNVIYFWQPPNSTFARQQAIKNELLRHPAINRIFLSSHEPGDGFMLGSFRPEGMATGESVALKHIAIDEHYLPTLGIDVTDGRNFSNEFATDTSDAVLINETAAKQFGWADPVGKRIAWLDPVSGSKTRTVIGMVEDYHFESLHRKIDPLILHYTPQQLFRYHMSTAPHALEATYDFLKRKWVEFDPNTAPTSYFLEQDLALEYRLEEIMGQMLTRFTILTIVIACLGLIGLASYSAEQRTKEIGVRKVLGATISNITGMLSLDFLKLVTLAIVVSWPLVYFVMKAWLDSFAYRVELAPAMFLICGAFALAVAWLTIGYQAVRASLTNPVDALRYE